MFAALGVLWWCASTFLLAGGPPLALRAVNDEMDDAHRVANRRSPQLADVDHKVYTSDLFGND